MPRAKKLLERPCTDMSKLSKELRGSVFIGEEPEVGVWLDVMEKSPHLKLCVRCLASLMLPWNVVSLSNWMHKRLTNLRKRDSTKYNKILARIPYSWSWKSRAKSNTHLRACYYVMDKYGNRLCHYSETASGLIRFVINALEHLTDQCVDGRRFVFEE